jgi:hypothetical protein
MSLLQLPPSLGKSSSEEDLGERRLKEKKMEDQRGLFRNIRMRRHGLYCCACEDRRVSPRPEICPCGHRRSHCSFCLFGESELSTKAKAHAKGCITKSTDDRELNDKAYSEEERERGNQVSSFHQMLPNFLVSDYITTIIGSLYAQTND